MADDIFHGLSRAELKKEIDALVARDSRSLPIKAKIFAAVARMQKFDLLPDVAAPDELTQLANEGAVELQRGISSAGGVSARLFASELVRGPLFPGTLTAFGQGIYLAEPSVRHPERKHFPLLSKTAHEYAKKGPPGMIVRCVVKTDARVVEVYELQQFLKEAKSRAKDVFGALDVGTFAASLGIDGFYCDGIGEHAHEKVWVIVNRGALVFQTIGLQINRPAIP